MQEIIPSSQALTEYSPSIETIIEEWLKSVYISQSRSERTVKAYKEYMSQFREKLATEGLDIHSNNQERIASIASDWAGSRSDKAKRSGPVARSTYDLRLAAISSFYVFIAEKQRHNGQPEYSNPINRIERPKIQAYASAEPLDSDLVASGLESIDRNTKQGKRDYAILAVALRTGRRASELINLRAKDITFIGDKVRIYFDNCKGGKKMKDLLDPETTAVLREYLIEVYGVNLTGFSGDSVVWASFSRRNEGKAMSIHTLYDICEKYLKTTKTHSLRHTFAHESEEGGATASDIQHRLGHATIGQTGTYLKAMRSDENPIGDKLVKKFGIKSLGEGK